VNAESNVPVEVGHWLVAIAPIVVLLVLLAVRRWTASQAGPVGILVAGAGALLFFRTGFEDLAVASGKGVWDAIFILLVVWPALLLYRVTDRAGAQEALRRGLTRFSRNELFLVLAFGWVFASFLQGITGFGTPIAVVAPLLVALGVRPVLAVVIPLIGHAWANLFGTLGVAWLGTLQVIDLADEPATALQTAILLIIPNLAGGLTVAWVFGRMPAVVHALPMVVIISVIHGGGQVALAQWDPILAAFIPATIALLVLYPLSGWQRYDEPADIDASIAMAEHHTEAEIEPDPVMGIGMSLMPYLVLTVAAVGLLAITPIRDALESVEVGPAFPAVETGYDVDTEAEDPYSPFTPLTHPGLFLLFGTAAAWITYRHRGYYEQWADRSGSRESIGPAVVADATPASVGIVTFLVVSQLMQHSGQTETLALGIAEVAPAGVYMVLTAGIGLLGSFMTTSNTSSNILFAPLQQSVAAAEGLSEAAVIGGQHAGGAIGNSIAPANIVLGTGTAGISGQEGRVLRLVFPWAVAVTALAGVGALLLDLV
jgi:lactate permease